MSIDELLVTTVFGLDLGDQNGYTSRGDDPARGDRYQTNDALQTIHQVVWIAINCDKKMYRDFR